MQTVEQYIFENIDHAIGKCVEDDEKYIGLPHPYSVPTVGDFFHSLFYWDTYFTNLALLQMGKIEQAKHNVEDFAALIERLGYIPNSNKRSLSDRSQPPFFSLMIAKIFDQTQDLDWLRSLYPSLCSEHAFWERERNTAWGLAHYGCPPPPDREERYARAFCKRVGVAYAPERQAGFAGDFMAQAESGWDFNARFGFDSLQFCAIDLNSLLWAMENNLASFSTLLQTGEEAKWREAADRRAAAMRRYLKTGDGIFLDRNVATEKFSSCYSAASLYPLFVGMATPEEAAAALAQMPRLMHAWGVAPCEVLQTPYTYQWASPNGWPCLQVIAADALRNYGYESEAKEIETRYVSMVERVFASTGALWEKYNLDTGNSDAVNEYEMPEMLGWTAGVYLHFKKRA